MSSREIAGITGKRHDHVIRDIDKLNESYELLGFPKVGEGFYKLRATGTQRHRNFKLTKMQTFDLMTGYNVQLRIRVNRRWEELENEKAEVGLALPSRKEMALMILQAEEELEQANETIALQAPKVEFAEEVFEAPTLLTMSEAAKMIGMGRNQLFAKLRMRKILMTGMHQNEPYQTFIERGYFELKGAKVGTRSALKVVTQTYVTMRGLAWIRLNIV